MSKYDLFPVSGKNLSTKIDRHSPEMQISINEEKWKEIIASFRSQDFGGFDSLEPEAMEKLLRDYVCRAVGEHCEEKRTGSGKKVIPKMYRKLFKKKKALSRKYNNQDIKISVEERNELKEKIRVIEQEIRRNKQDKIDREEEDE